MAKKKGLKRGLDYLFDESDGILDTMEDSEGQVENILISDITPNPYQPRKEFNEEALNELAQSIKENGVFQPILVRKTIIGYEIISGERRFRASKIASLDTIPAIVYDYDDKQMMEVALIENVQREDLDILEEANSYAALIKELNYTQEDLSKKIGKSRPHIANLLRIINLDEQILKAIKDKKISLGHAKILVGIKDLDYQKEVFSKIIEQNLNVRQTESLVKNGKTPPKEKQPKKQDKNKTNYKQLEDIMIDKLGTNISITGKDSGQIKIDYNSVDDLERLLEILKIL